MSWKINKLIDFEKKGNVIRCYFGYRPDYYGDDWDDKPYEHNAGKVRDEYIDKYIDYAFPNDFLVTEPADDWHYKGNSPYSKDDMKREICPCIIATKDDENYSELFLSYHTLLTGKDKNVVRKNPQTLKLYFNTREEDVTSDIEHIGGMKIYEKITG